MRKKNIAIFLIFVSFFGVNLPAIACCEGSPQGDPSCYECRDGVWKLKSSAACGKDSHCGANKKCLGCRCFTECAWDSQCEQCEVCYGTLHVCVSILPCPVYTHCDNHACVPDCEENGPICTYTDPGVYHGCDHPLDSYECLDAGGPCLWELIYSTPWEAHCVIPGCTTLPTYCAKLVPRLCYDKFVAGMGVVCACDEYAPKGEPIKTGSRQRCP